MVTVERDGGRERKNSLVNLPIDDFCFLLDLRQWTVADFLNVQVEIQALGGEFRLAKFQELANTCRITEEFFAVE